MKPTFFAPLQDPNDEMPDLLPDEDDIDLIDGEDEGSDA
jgi:hypothetical protein